MQQPFDVPKLAGWVTTTEAAELLGTDKAGVYRLLFEEGCFPGARAVGEKPLYVIPEEEVLLVKAEQARRQSSRREFRQLREQRRETHRAIKQWGVENGFAVHPKGSPSKALRDAYAGSHPEE